MTTPTNPAPRRLKYDGLKSFFISGTEFPGYEYGRHYRTNRYQIPIKSLIERRLDPKPPYQRSPDNSRFDTLARHDVLLPADAPGDIGSASDLLMRFDQTPPLREDVLMSFRIEFAPTTPAHCGYEQVRAWALWYLCDLHNLAVIMVLHQPGLAGSANPDHVHLFVPSRKLGINGFGCHVSAVCCDEGNSRAYRTWLKFSRIYRSPDVQE